MAINFSELELESISFEVRFSSAFGLWDRAGLFAHSVQEAFPDLKLSQAEPGNISFNIGRSFGLTVNLDKAVISGFRVSKDVERFTSLVQTSLDALVETLGVAAFSRIGIRPVYVKRYPSKEAAGIAVATSGLIKITDKKVFNVDVEGAHIQGEYVFRREGSSLGFMLHVFALGQKIEFAANIDVDPKDVPDVAFEKYGLAVDVDYYTTASSAVGSFRATDWINQALHTIARDARTVLGDA